MGVRPARIRRRREGVAPRGLEPLHGRAHGLLADLFGVFLERPACLFGQRRKNLVEQGLIALRSGLVADLAAQAAMDEDGGQGRGQLPGLETDPDLEAEGTADGRYLFVVLEKSNDTVFKPITDRDMTEGEKRSYRRLLR